jgi:Ca2+-transporting ATPase
LDEQRLLQLAALACAPEAFDPMDQAISRTAKLGADGRSLVRSYALSSKLLAVTQVWRRPGLSSLLVAAKGAPEAIIELCHPDPVQAATIRGAIEELANRGIRVLGVAHAEVSEGPLPETARARDRARLLPIAGAELVRLRILSHRRVD